MASDNRAKCDPEPRTLLRRRFDAMMAISSQSRLLVSKSSVSFG